MIGVQAQTDVTSTYLTNPSFETGDLTGWTAFGHNDADTPVPTAALVTDKPLENAAGDRVCNFQWWCHSNSSKPNGISQTISNLPAGCYRLTAVTGAPTGWTIYLYASGGSVTSSTMTADYDGTLQSVDFAVASTSDVTIKAIVRDGNNGWKECNMRVDDFKLYSLDIPVLAGWSKVENTADLRNNPTDYYFAIISADNQDLMLQASNSNAESQKLYYKSIPSSASALNFFEIENYESDKFVLKSSSIGKYFANSSGEPWNYHANKTSVDADCEITITGNGIYTIQDKFADGSNNYVGLWSPGNGYKDGQYLAGNKSSAEAGSFLIYRKPKAGLTDYTGYLANPDFEGNYATTNLEERTDRYIYSADGWKITYGTKDQWNCSALNSDCKSWNNFQSLPQPADGGKNVYWARFPYTQGSSIKLYQTVNLPSGYYSLKAEGYAATNSKVTISAKYDTETTKSAELTAASWNTAQVLFYLSSAQDVEISGKLERLTGSISGIDNFTLTRLDYSNNGDVTGLIINPNCDRNDGWPGGGRTLDNMVAYDGTTRDVFSSNSYLDPSSKNGQRSQTITLPLAGTYKLTTFSKVPGTNSNGYAQIWVDDLNNYVNHTNARHLYTVDTDGSKTNTINTDGSGWFANDIYFTATADEDKTIYINLSRGNGGGTNTEYAYASGMKLTYLGTTPAISFDEAVVNPVVEEDLAHANVTIARNMKSDRWNTFTVPFDMANPDGWTVKELTALSYDGASDNYSLTFSDASSIVAGKAYMVKPSSDVIEVSANDVTINTNTVTSSKVTDGGYSADFIGNNSYLTSVPTGSYIISNNVFYIVDSSIIQKGFRGYITVDGNAGSRSTVTFGEEDGPTGIETVTVNGLESNAQQDGKYFIGNRIVIVKNNVKYSANGQILK